MALQSLLGIGDLSGALTLAGIVASLPVAGHRGLLKEGRKGPRSPKEKEFGPPDFDDFMRVWEGLCQVRRSEHYGLSARNEDVVTSRDVIVRVASLCRRADWRSNLERKLVALAIAQGGQGRRELLSRPRHSVHRQVDPDIRSSARRCSNI